jgi:hypothetical protein
MLGCVKLSWEDSEEEDDIAKNELSMKEWWMGGARATIENSH